MIIFLTSEYRSSVQNVLSLFWDSQILFWLFIIFLCQFCTHHVWKSWVSSFFKISIVIHISLFHSPSAINLNQNLHPWDNHHCVFWELLHAVHWQTQYYVSVVKVQVMLLVNLMSWLHCGWWSQRAGWMFHIVESTTTWEMSWLCGYSTWPNTCFLWPGLAAGPIYFI